MKDSPRRFAALFAVAAWSLTACAGGSSRTVPAFADRTATPSGAVSVSINVPTGSAPTAAARSALGTRAPRYISYGSKSVVFTLDQPQVDQTDLQHRTVEYDLVPGPNAIALDVEDGELTIKATIYDAAGGKGHELSITDSQTVTLDLTQPTTIDLVFNPIIVQAGVQLVPGSLTLLTLSHNERNGEVSNCYGLAGQYTLSGFDADGYFVNGAGHYLDTSHNPVTVTAGPAGIIDSKTTTSAVPSGGVAISGGSAASPSGGGSFSQTSVDQTEAGVAVGATASSSLVKPAATIGGLGVIYVDLSLSFATSACEVTTGG